VSAAAAPRPRRRWIWVIVAILTALLVVPPFALRIWLKAEIQHQTEQVPVLAHYLPPGLTYVTPTGIVAQMISHASRSVGVSIRRLRRVAKNALTIATQSRQK